MGGSIEHICPFEDQIFYKKKIIKSYINNSKLLVYPQFINYSTVSLSYIFQSLL